MENGLLRLDAEQNLFENHLTLPLRAELFGSSGRIAHKFSENNVRQRCGGRLSRFGAGAAGTNAQKAPRR
jgi:hypothetical protein